MVGLFDSPDYNEIALNALQQLVLMTATHMPEKGFSYLGELMGIGRAWTTEALFYILLFTLCRTMFVCYF